MENIIEAKNNEIVVKAKAKKALLWVSMVSMLMIFASLTSAYIVRKEKGDWLQFELPQLFYISTAIILISSITMNWVLAAAKKNNFKHTKLAALLTLLLGLAFVVCQFQAWGTLVEQKIVFAGMYSNASGSFLYVLTGLHLAHLFGGIIAISVVWIKSIQEKYNSENLLGIRLCAIFWHFLDFLWIYLFLFLIIQR